MNYMHASVAFREELIVDLAMPGMVQRLWQTVHEQKMALMMATCGMGQRPRCEAGHAHQAIALHALLCHKQLGTNTNKGHRLPLRMVMHAYLCRMQR